MKILETLLGLFLVAFLVVSWIAISSYQQSPSYLVDLRKQPFASFVEIGISKNIIPCSTLYEVLSTDDSGREIPVVSDGIRVHISVIDSIGGRTLESSWSTNWNYKYRAWATRKGIPVFLIDASIIAFSVIAMILMLVLVSASGSTPSYPGTTMENRLDKIS